MPTRPPKAEEDEWERIWDARIAALTPILGKPVDSVYHATVPLSLGGFADVLKFPKYIPGVTYVTAELTGGEAGQPPNALGNYELMICVRKELPRAADLISRLARYTCETKLEPGETMDLPDFFSGSVIKALLFTHPGDHPLKFKLLDRWCGALVCIGITADELEFKETHGPDALLELLKKRDVFPYTELQRESVTP
jgi:hypothetical protein